MDIFHFDFDFDGIVSNVELLKCNIKTCLLDRKMVVCRKPKMDDIFFYPCNGISSFLHMLLMDIW